MINFDEWVELYKNDPVEFEKKRRAIISQQINSAPPQIRDKLYALQAEIEIIRAKTKDPLETTKQIMKMLDKQSEDLEQALKKLISKI